jgi:CubicO group peptidase (beta-lactamase class C family)
MSLRGYLSGGTPESGVAPASSTPAPGAATMIAMEIHGQVQGQCDDRFAEVAEVFERNLTSGAEVGASVAVTVAGETVVDLWGGHLDAERSRPWEKDSLCVIMSCTKGATALCAHLLAAAGDLDVDAPVATYWPEFAAAGKEGVLVRHLLNHQAGLPAIRQPLEPGAFYDWGTVTTALAAEAPFWEPGTRYGYHALTFGFLVGEVVRRISGTPLGRFFADEVAGPLGLDLFIGLPDREHGRVAAFLPPPMPEPGAPLSRYMLQAMTEPESIPWLVMQNNGGYLVPGVWDGPDALRADLPSSGGVANARALAGMYRAIVHDRTIGRFTLDTEDIVRMGAVQSAVLEDAVLMGPGRWTLGFHKGASTPTGVEPAARVSLSEEAFGHTGFGGSIGFADPGCDLSFAYVMNQMAGDQGLGPTGQGLVDATYTALGYKREKYDTWVRP